MRSLPEIQADPANRAPLHWDDATQLSDDLLAADIEVLGQSVKAGVLGNIHALTLRYVDLVTERHRRTLERGRKQEQELLYVRKMLEELALLGPESPTSDAGWSYEVDDVWRDEDGNIVTILGTSTSPGVPTLNRPYILGEVQ